MIFNVTDTVNKQITSRFALGPISTFYGWLTQLVNTRDGKVKALAAILLTVVMLAVHLKKSFCLHWHSHVFKIQSGTILYQ